MPEDRIVADNQPAKQLLVLAAGLLAGEVAMRQGNVEPAEKFFRQAIAREDALPYTEPPPWSLPVRHYLGALLLDQKKYPEAIAVYEEDLKRNPNNGWSLYGLAAATRATKPDEAKQLDERATAAWQNADVELTSSRF
jgi:tetratricopeptide (TPR) repeat protein